MYQFTKDISPIYSRYRPTDIKPIMDTFKAFNPDSDEFTLLKYIEFVGLPKAVWRFFEVKTGKTGREAVKKLTVQVKVGSIKSIGGKKCRNIHDLLIQSCFDVVKKASANAKVFMVFNFGIVKSGGYGILGDASDAVANLPLPVMIKGGDL